MNLFPTTELMTEYWSTLSAKKNIPSTLETFKPELTQSFIEFQEFQRSSVIKLFVLQIDRGEQNASLCIAGV